MSPILSVFDRSPDRGRGLARDMRVRWALEEVGRPYEVRRLSFEALKAPDHLGRHPFGQIPVYEDGDLTLFESGAIVLHLAERHGGLLPDDPHARSRAIGWMFAALNTVEPPIFDRSLAMVLERDQPWFEARIEALDARIRTVLGRLSDRLGDADWLDGAFSAGDLLTATVLLRIKGTPLLDDQPRLAAYLARAEARPAYQRAFAAQLATFETAPAD